MADVNSIEKIIPSPAVSSTSLGQIAYETTYKGGKRRSAKRLSTKRLSRGLKKRKVAKRSVKKCWWKFF
jgi:hypothetical protein